MSGRRGKIGATCINHQFVLRSGDSLHIYHHWGIIPTSGGTNYRRPKVMRCLEWIIFCCSVHFYILMFILVIRQWQRSTPTIPIPPFQIIVCLIFFHQLWPLVLFKKIVQTKSNLNHSWRPCIDKASYNKKSNILHKFLNKTSCQTWTQKSQMNYDLKRREYKAAQYWCNWRVRQKPITFIAAAASLLVM